MNFTGKILALSCAACLCISSFSACTKQNASDKPETVPKQESHETTPKEENPGNKDTTPVTLYNVDGKMKTVEAYIAEDEETNGWYTEPVLTMYAENGDTKVVTLSSRKDEKENGWSEITEYCLTRTFSELNEQFGKLTFRTNYESGFYFLTKDNKVSLGFYSEDFDYLSLDLLENPDFSPVAYDPDKTDCRSLFINPADAFPAIIHKADSNGVMHVDDIKDYLGCNYDLSYSEMDEAYCASFVTHNTYLDIPVWYLIITDEDGYFNIKETSIEVYRKTPSGGM